MWHGDLRQASDLETLPPVDWVIDAAANPSVLAGVDGKTSSLQLVQHNLLGTAQATQVWGWTPQIKIDQVLQEIAEFAEANDHWCSISVSA
ncbi:MAG: hypothetical protein LVS60_14050 [Nodosilinea sp. LVE1205-7]